MPQFFRDDAPQARAAGNPAPRGFRRLLVHDAATGSALLLASTCANLATSVECKESRALTDTAATRLARPVRSVAAAIASQP